MHKYIYIYIAARLERILSTVRLFPAMPPTFLTLFLYTISIYIAIYIDICIYIAPHIERDHSLGAHILSTREHLQTKTLNPEP